ncbi:RING/U-box superfamily protein [Hibiscus syriacus]|uniref:RING/U-box superfamily protein n=1 Tax=Hibiscus syriacus TaxID=106335 RepID=A0A6A2X817_HIBSY|nr:RING/U-box superfamily protein [Hibiscus syriacus]
MNNELRGEVPNLDFSNLQQFNNFSGLIPDVKGRFSAGSFSGNPGLCGEIVSRPCPPSKRKSGDSSAKNFAIYSGYAALGLIAVLFIAFKLVGKTKPKQDTIAVEANASRHSNETNSTSNESKITENKSEYSTSPTVQGLRFKDLLRAPAELLGRGKHGSLYKARHPNVFAPVAFYCSKQEKHLVYEYQPNGSLFRLLHGSESGQALEWESRLNVAAIVAVALAFMHGELREDGIAHGNLKSTNILFNQNMDPGISEYGLMVFQHQSFDLQSDNVGNDAYGSFKGDIYGSGVILLELLTGKPVQANGIDLTRWVHSVVTEEWTVEVFDKALISQGASEERMLNLF